MSPSNSQPSLAATLAAGRRGRDANRRLLGWDEMPAGVWKAIEAELAGREQVEVAPALAALRRVKDAAQLALHRNRELQLCDRMFAGPAEEIQVEGRFTHHIKAEMELVVRREGVEYVGSWMTGGRQPGLLTLPPAREPAGRPARASTCSPA